MRKTDFETVAAEPTAALGVARQRQAGIRSSQKILPTRQTSLANPVSLEGVGLHSGAPVRLTLRPAAADTGWLFRRTDLGVSERAVTDIRLAPEAVCETVLNTTIGNAAGTKISTIEHLMAAVAGLSVDNLIIEINGPEVPIMDGSAADFAAAIQQAGVRVLGMPRKYIRVLKPVVVEDGIKRVEIAPYDGFRLEFEIEFDSPVIGHETMSVDLTDETFRAEVCSARTFGFLKDVEAMWAVGLARGGSLENSIVIDGAKVLNEGGLRFADEFVRHKVLDAVGDLSVAGAPLLARYSGVRAGHAINNQALRALFADADAWEYVTLTDRQPARETARPVAAIAVSAD